MDDGTAVRGVVTDQAPARHAANAAALEKDLQWLSQVIEARVRRGQGSSTGKDIWDIPAPRFNGEESLYSSFLRHYEMSAEERLAVLLALAPHVRPETLDGLFHANEQLGRGHTEFGGIQGRMHGGFLPTGETLLFLLAGNDLTRRFACQRIFDRDHFFARHNILRLETAPAGEPMMSGQLVLADEIVDFVTGGELRKPDFSRDFPAKLITTEMSWEDLVLAPGTLDQIKELEAWIKFEPVLMNDWGLERRLRPGYRCLFHGPPGTGKTLTATVIGKRLNLDVYRVALSSVISKYIGETEKNLERIFGRAENMRCILFFDEADALFGKRTTVSDAHDRYANQEVSYLLQRIEDFAGVVILASNFIGNMDEAFMRRFQAAVHFPMPNVEERHRLWRDSLSKKCLLEKGLKLDELSCRYELSGGAIMNVVRYASLMALAEGSNVIRHCELMNGIRRELQKDGKTI
ncbi:MAG: AAA family ATPase [Deltaproteobacteria bacterium HGW-Deltaproteobacteria-15]|jgi:hypothetical protein|nr:MAG: AAA family ATPase [Deltaproteobacteria bacterium HGW-Deltaproteobacteria-15]